MTQGRMRAKADPWCVKHRDGWCAIKSGMRPAENAVNVPTKCGHVVVLPIGFMQTIPDCDECRESDTILERIMGVRV